MIDEDHAVSLRDLVGKGYDGFWQTRKFYRMVKGSKGSKKSKTTALWYIYHIMKYPDANLLVIKKTYRSLENSCFADLQWAIEKLGCWQYWRSSTSPLQLTYLPTGQTILFSGMDDPMKLASITVSHGYLCWVWFEEFSDITDQEAFTKIVMSIRGYIPPETGLFKQITGTFNPWSEHSWIKKEFFDKPRDDTFTATTTFRDNEFLGDDDIQRYMDLYKTNPRAARIICDGEWGVSAGLIYENWTVEEFDYRDILKNPHVKASFGLDFGYKISYNAFVAILVDVGARTLWVYDEWYERGLTNIDIAKKITAMGYENEIIYADSAEPKSIFELQAGLPEEYTTEDGERRVHTWALPNIRPALKGPDSVMNGIQRLQSFRIIVHPRCENVIMELKNYCYAQDVDGNYINKPIKDYDHAMDSIRYGSDRFFVHAHGFVAEAKGQDNALPKPNSGRRSKRVVSSI